MESNNIVTAPQFDDFGEAFQYWKEQHSGTAEEFLVFLTTPSVKRDEFLSTCHRQCSFSGAVASITFATP